MDVHDYSDIDYSSIDSVLGDILDNGRGFSDYVGDIVDGGGISYDGIYNNIIGVFSGEFDSIKSTLGNMILIILIASIFINIAKSFNSRQVSENGFYITYMLMFILISVSFGQLESLSSDVLEKLVSFVKALLPTFFLTVTYVTGEGAIVFYQSALAVIALVELVLGSIFLPAVKIYFIFGMINPMLEEKYCTRLLEFIEKFIEWGLKGILTIVSGIGIIQGLIVPAAAGMKKGIFNKVVKSIPGAGNTMDTVLESVYGAGVLIKNSVGVAGLIIIFAICVVPVIKIGSYMIVYHAGAALSEPLISDKRMIDCICAASKAARLLLMVVFVAVLMFVVTIGIIAASTS